MVSEPKQSYGHVARNPDELLAEISEIISKEVDKNRKVVREILIHLEVGEEEYKGLMVIEVVGSVLVDAMFAFPPQENHTPDDVREKALKIFYKKLERDKRIYLKIS